MEPRKMVLINLFAGKESIPCREDADAENGLVGTRVGAGRMQREWDEMEKVTLTYIHYHVRNR